MTCMDGCWGHVGVGIGNSRWNHRITLVVLSAGVGLIARASTKYISSACMSPVPSLHSIACCVLLYVCVCAVLCSAHPIYRSLRVIGSSPHMLIACACVPCHIPRADACLLAAFRSRCLSLRLLLPERAACVRLSLGCLHACCCFPSVLVIIRLACSVSL